MITEIAQHFVSFTAIFKLIAQFTFIQRNLSEIVPKTPRFFERFFDLELIYFFFPLIFIFQIHKEESNELRIFAEN